MHEEPLRGLIQRVLHDTAGLSAGITFTREQICQIVALG